MARITQESSFDDWKAAAQAANIVNEAVRFGAKLKRIGSEWVGPCPACGGRDRFAVNPMKRKYVCRGAGGGDVVGMVMHIANYSFLEAVEALSGEPPPYGQAKPLTAEERAEREQRRIRREAEDRRRVEQEIRYREQRADTAADVWRQSTALAGTLGVLYLGGRGIPEPLGGWPDCIRFHPGLVYELSDQRLIKPCIVCRVDDVSGNLIAIWRIYIDPKTAGKAFGKLSKIGLGPASGGAVRIGGVGPRINVAEGLETALAVWFLTGMKHPTWACLSTAGMTNVELPIDVQRVVIFPDGDEGVRRNGEEYVPEPLPPGIRAARALRDRLVPSGVKCSIEPEPSMGSDYLDVWNRLHAREVA